MKSPSDEYHATLAALKSHVLGQELIQEGTAFSRWIGDTLFDVLEHTPKQAEAPSSLRPLIDCLLTSDTAKMALCLLGRKRCIDGIEKNLLLMLGRLLSFARTVDALPVHEKLRWAIGGIDIFASRVQDWMAHLEESTRHIHDKKERRERRHLLQQEAHHLAGETVLKLCVSVLHHVVDLLLPSGAASLYLPPEGALFVPKIQEMIDSFLPKVAHWVVDSLFRRDLKTDALYYLYSSLPLWLAKPSEAKAEEVAVQDVSSIVEQLTPAIPPLCHAFIPSLAGSFAEPQMLASTVVEAIVSALQSHSLESLLFAACACLAKREDLSFTHHAEQELDQLIDVMTYDERILRAIIKKGMAPPELPVPARPGVAAAFFELVVYGLKASAAEIMTQGALASVNWEEAQRLCLERLRWFVLSPYFDQVILASVQRIEVSTPKGTPLTST